MAIVLKHSSAEIVAEDGARVLVDRWLPRGMKEEVLALRNWLPTLAPSTELQRWFATKPAQWKLFRQRYLTELEEPEALAALQELAELADGEERITLLTSADEPEHSHAAVLRDLLSGARKPPATTGPARAASAGRARARRPR
jgi:uncharacterized protein YeaO (DUF488 family)